MNKCRDCKRLYHFYWWPEGTREVAHCYRHHHWDLPSASAPGGFILRYWSYRRVLENREPARSIGANCPNYTWWGKP